MHILVLPNNYPSSSQPYAGIFFVEQAEALARKGIEVGMVYTRTRSLREFGIGKFLRETHFQQERFERNGVNTWLKHAWNPLITSGPGRKIWLYWVLKTVEKYIRRFGKPDMIHAHCVCWAGDLARTIQKKWNIPYVITEHSSAFLTGNYTPKKFIKEAYDHADRVWAVSEKLCKAISPLTGRAVNVMPNFVNTRFFSEQPLSGKPENRPFTFFSLGNLAPHKGFEELIHAFTASFGKDENVRLVIGGTGYLYSHLRRISVENNRERQIEFTGPLSREEVKEWMYRSDVFVLASHFETFGVVFIEAMACGLPTIGTRCGGPEELIVPETGYLTEVGDTEELANTMKQARENRDRFDPAFIRQHAAQYDSDYLAGQLLEQYEK